MSFIEKLENTLNEDYNTSITENGATGYRTTAHALLDMNFKVPTYRKYFNEEIISDFEKALAEDKILAIKWMFYLRDVRGGLGERKSFRQLLKYVGDRYVDLAAKIIPLVAEYGRYDDLLEFLGTESEKDVLAYIKEQMITDRKLQNENKPISLLAKWLPSENASSEATKGQAKKIRTYLNMSSKDYRKYLSSARSYLKIVEKDMSAKNWSEINYEIVPSRANLNYNKAFLRNDEERRRVYLDALSKGEKKIHAGVLYPYDIVHQYTDTYGWREEVKKYDETLEQLWKNLPNVVDGSEGTIVVADGSGSMTCAVSAHVSALEVANSLAIYFAERCSGEFKNKYITFSEHPQLVNLRGESLHDALREAYRHDECANTNIEATFDLILDTAVQNKMPQEEMPKNILIVSDMEFDMAQGWGQSKKNEKLFKTIANKYAAAGYKLPRLIFWNVNSRTNTIPMRENELGVILVSGFSVNIFNMVLNGELDPYKALVKELSKERYSPVEEAIKDIIKTL